MSGERGKVQVVRGLDVQLDLRYQSKILPLGGEELTRVESVDGGRTRRGLDGLALGAAVSDSSESGGGASAYTVRGSSRI